MKECARLLHAVELASALSSTMNSAALDNATDPVIRGAQTYAYQAHVQACNALANARRRCTCGASVCTGVPQ